MSLFVSYFKNDEDYFIDQGSARPMCIIVVNSYRRHKDALWMLINAMLTLRGNPGVVMYAMSRSRLTNTRMAQRSSYISPELVLYWPNIRST